LVIRGAYVPEFLGTAKHARKKLSSIFRGLGAYVVPGATAIAQPGSDLHYAGTLPMGTATAPDGQLKGADRLYVVDASVLPYLPATHCTFTVMANADRAMRSLIARGRPPASSG
jgi:choline dehydrogenase-like flavoprotein